MITRRMSVFFYCDDATSRRPTTEEALYSPRVTITRVHGGDQAADPAAPDRLWMAALPSPESRPRTRAGSMKVESYRTTVSLIRQLEQRHFSEIERAVWINLGFVELT